MALYRSKKPRDKLYNLTILWYVYKYRRFFIGTYYFPDVNDMLIVLKTPKGVELPKKFFERVTQRDLENAYKMVCIGCGVCCEYNAGSFVFYEELRDIGFNVLLSECEDVTLLNGVKTKICSLQSREHGMCILYDVSTQSCRVHNRKPVICLVSYCGLVAVKNDKIFYRYGFDSQKRPMFREWSGSLDKLRDNVKEYVLKYIVKQSL